MIFNIQDFFEYQTKALHNEYKDKYVIKQDISTDDVLKLSYQYLSAQDELSNGIQDTMMQLSAVMFSTASKPIFENIYGFKTHKGEVDGETYKYDSVPKTASIQNILRIYNETFGESQQSEIQLSNNIGDYSIKSKEIQSLSNVLPLPNTVLNAYDIYQYFNNLANILQNLKLLRYSLYFKSSRYANTLNIVSCNNTYPELPLNTQLSSGNSYYSAVLVSPRAEHNNVQVQDMLGNAVENSYGMKLILQSNDNININYLPLSSLIYSNVVVNDIPTFDLTDKNGSNGKYTMFRQTDTQTYDLVSQVKDIMEMFEIKSGTLIESKKIVDAISYIYQLWLNNLQVLQYTFYACHYNCHGRDFNGQDQYSAITNQKQVNVICQLDEQLDEAIKRSCILQKYQTTYNYVSGLRITINTPILNIADFKFKAIVVGKERQQSAFKFINEYDELSQNQSISIQLTNYYHTVLVTFIESPTEQIYLASVNSPAISGSIFELTYPSQSMLTSFSDMSSYTPIPYSLSGNDAYNIAHSYILRYGIDYCISKYHNNDKVADIDKFILQNNLQNIESLIQYASIALNECTQYALSIDAFGPMSILSELSTVRQSIDEISQTISSDIIDIICPDLKALSADISSNIMAYDTNILSALVENVIPLITDEYECNSISTAITDISNNLITEKDNINNSISNFLEFSNTIDLADGTLPNVVYAMYTSLSSSYTELSTNILSSKDIETPSISSIILSCSRWYVDIDYYKDMYFDETEKTKNIQTSVENIISTGESVSSHYSIYVLSTYEEQQLLTKLANIDIFKTISAYAETMNYNVSAYNNSISSSCEAIAQNVKYQQRELLTTAILDVNNKIDNLSSTVNIVNVSCNSLYEIDYTDLEPSEMLVISGMIEELKTKLSNQLSDDLTNIQTSENNLSGNIINFINQNKNALTDESKSPYISIRLLGKYSTSQSGNELSIPYQIQQKTLLAIDTDIKISQYLPTIRCEFDSKTGKYIRPTEKLNELKTLVKVTYNGKLLNSAEMNALFDINYQYTEPNYKFSIIANSGLITRQNIVDESQPYVVVQPKNNQNIIQYSQKKIPFDVYCITQEQPSVEDKYQWIYLGEIDKDTRDATTAAELIFGGVGVRNNICGIGTWLGKIYTPTLVKSNLRGVSIYSTKAYQKHDNNCVHLLVEDSSPYGMYFSTDTINTKIIAPGVILSDYIGFYLPVRTGSTRWAFYVLERI